MGLTNLAIFTSLFAALVVFASYVAFSRYIEGEEVVAPDVHSRTVVDALELLKSARLSLILDRREPNETLGEGRIISQHPRPGLRVKAGASIHVVVSSGSRHVEIPQPPLGIRGQAREIGPSFGGSGAAVAQLLAKEMPVATGPLPSLWREHGHGNASDH